MTTEPRNPDLIARAIAANARLGEALLELISIMEAILATLSTPVEPPVKPPLNALQTSEEALTAHRRAHRSGRPAKIEGDPELETFIADKIATLTFAEVAEAVAAAFPPDRHTRTSAAHRWWQKRQARAGQAGGVNTSAGARREGGPAHSRQTAGASPRAPGIFGPE